MWSKSQWAAHFNVFNACFHEHLALRHKALAFVKPPGRCLGMQAHQAVATFAGHGHEPAQDLTPQPQAAMRGQYRHAAYAGLARTMHQ